MVAASWADFATLIIKQEREVPDCAVMPALATLDDLVVAGITERLTAHQLGIFTATPARFLTSGRWYVVEAAAAVGLGFVIPCQIVKV